jgi:hypothetical protein
MYIYISLHTTNISFNRNWCGKLGDGVDRGLLNYVFILYTPFNNEPNNATFLRQSSSWASEKELLM